MDIMTSVEKNGEYESEVSKNIDNWINQVVETRKQEFEDKLDEIKKSLFETGSMSKTSLKVGIELDQLIVLFGRIFNETDTDRIIKLLSKTNRKASMSPEEIELRDLREKAKEDIYNKSLKIYEDYKKTANGKKFLKTSVVTNYRKLASLIMDMFSPEEFNQLYIAWDHTFFNKVMGGRYSSSYFKRVVNMFHGHDIFFWETDVKYYNRRYEYASITSSTDYESPYVGKDRFKNFSADHPEATNLSEMLKLLAQNGVDDIDGAARYYNLTSSLFVRIMSDAYPNPKAIFG